MLAWGDPRLTSSNNTCDQAESGSIVPQFGHWNAISDPAQPASCDLRNGTEYTRDLPVETENDVAVGLRCHIAVVEEIDLHPAP
jgi:hypothetical protein